jgi:predicted GNAT family N-acyltransferase
MPAFRVDVIRTAEQLQEAFAIRTRVFVEEQHVPPAEEIDRYDTDPAAMTHAVHALGRLDGTPIATGRLLLVADAAGLPHIGRVAVLAPHRTHGYGTAIMEALHAEARTRGFVGATLAAQIHAIPFYAGLGYVAHGPLFMDAGIEHRQMDIRFQG